VKRLIIVFALASALGLAGCVGSTAPARFYSLQALAAADAPVGSVPRLAIGPITVPDSLDRSQMITRLSTYEVRVDEFARWAEPLDKAIARVLGENLGALLDAQAVATVPGDGSTKEGLRLSVQVVSFEVDATSSTLVARWSLWRGAPGDPAVTRKSTCVAERSGEDAASVAAAMSECLAQLAREVAEVAK
jgi:uncharacterized lipoprotein YmbA